VTGAGAEFTPGELDILAAVGSIRGNPIQDAAVREIADMIREDFPAVPDALLAKVTLALARAGATLIDVTPDAPATALTGLFGRLAWVLAEVELETNP
jgi:hypothetical protein